MNCTAKSGAAMVVDYDVALEVASHEAIIRQTYKDSEGVLTWSVGLTNATGHRVERYLDKPQSLEHCLNIYVWALKNYAAGVRKAFKGHKLTKAQFAAALSFHWNTGAIGRAKWVEHFKSGRTAQARRAFMNFRRPAAIIPRRRKERDLFFDGKWTNTGAMTEYTRLTRKRTPVWSSAKRINVERELRAAFRNRKKPTLDLTPKPDNRPLAPTLSPSQPEGPVTEVTVEKEVVRDREDLDKPIGKSKTFWQWLLTAIAAPAAAFGGFDWRVQLAIIVAIIAIAAYGIYARYRLARIYRELKSEFGAA